MRQFLANMKPGLLRGHHRRAFRCTAPARWSPSRAISRASTNPESVQYEDPKLKPILSVTYGCMVYQEQVMQIVRDLAGYSMGRSDLVRRAMAKKKHDVMAQGEGVSSSTASSDPDGSIDVPGAVRRGVSEQVAEHLFEEMTAFASYAFNKSARRGLRRGRPADRLAQGALSRPVHGGA